MPYVGHRGSIEGDRLKLKSGDPSGHALWAD